MAVPACGLAPCTVSEFLKSGSGFHVFSDWFGAHVRGVGVGGLGYGSCLNEHQILLRDSGFGFQVPGSGFRVSGIEFRVWGVGCGGCLHEDEHHVLEVLVLHCQRVLPLRFRLRISGFRVSELRFPRVSGFGFRGFGFRIPRFRVSGFRVPGFG